MPKIETQPSDLIDLAAIEERLKGKSPQELRAHFRECWNGITSAVAECAVCVKLLEASGESLTGIRWAGTFRRVASGAVLPELVTEFIESPNLRTVEWLPPKDQKKIVNDPMVLAAERTPEGGWTKRKVDLRTCHKEVAKQIVSDDGIRSLEEQQAYLATQKARPTSAKPVEEEEDSGPLVHRITVELTEIEWRTIRTYAAQHGCSERKAARMFLIRSTLFRQVKL